MDYTIMIKESYKELKQYLPFEPEVGLILGSGLGELADQITDPVYVDYSKIRFFPVSTVEGHAGRFVIGELGGKKVIAMQGRFHYYEGYSMTEVTLPIRVMKMAGVKKLILTNAAGGVNLDYNAGDLMLIKDHINNAALNPLIGANIDEHGPRFVDLGNVYDKSTNEKVKTLSKELGIDLKEGVYQFNPGPAYETPAEVRMARILGSDAVGMSTVPEAVVAAHCGMQVTGISCITNMASGVLDAPLNHEEVIETANRVKNTFSKLVLSILPII